MKEQFKLEKEHFLRKLTLGDLFCLGINGVIGSGIFLLPGLAFQKAGNLSSLSFLLCAFLCFSLGLVFAELAGKFPGSGAAYEYTRRIFGSGLGFCVGWMMWIASLVGWASLAKGFTLYLGFFVQLGKTWETVILVLLFSLLAVVNCRGVKPGSIINSLFTLLKFIPLLLFVFWGIFHLKPQMALQLYPASLPELKGLGEAVFLVMFAYLGFEAIPIPAQETINPERNLPRAIFAVLGTAGIFYLLVQMVCLSVNPNLGASRHPLSDSAALFMGRAGSDIITWGALLSILGACASLTITVPRLLYLLSRDGFLPEKLSALHSDFKTPATAILLSSSLALLLALSESFEKLAAFTVLATLWQFLPALAGVLVLKFKGEELKFFKGKKGYLWLGFAGSSLLILFLQVSWLQFLGSLAAIGAGVVLFFINRGFKIFKRS